MTRSLSDELKRLGLELAKDDKTPRDMDETRFGRALHSSVLRYRLRSAGIGVASCAAVASLAIGVVHLWPQPSAPGEGGPSGDSGTIDIRWDDRSLISPFDTLPECGDPAPTPLTSSEGLTLTVYEGSPGVVYDADSIGYGFGPGGEGFGRDMEPMMVTTMDGTVYNLERPTLDNVTPAEGVGSPLVYDPETNPFSPTVFGVVSSTRDMPTSALISKPGIVVVQGGVVVGYVDPVQLGTLSMLGDGTPALTAGDGGTYSVQVCSGGTTVVGELPIGDYELYEVVRVTASPVTAALAHRWTLAPVEGDFGRPLVPAFSPGSWECANQTSGFAVAVVECDPSISVNLADNTVRLPYPEGTYNDDYEVVLVSGPREYSVLNNTNLDFDWEETYFPAAPACGATYDMNGTGEGIGLSIPLEHLWPTGERTDYTAQVMPPEDARSGTITLEGPLEVWVSRVYAFNREDNPTYPLNQHEEIVGHASLTLNDNAPIAVNRSSGPTRVPAIVSDLEWCPGVMPGDDGGGETRVYVVGTVSWDDGTGPVEIHISGNVDHSSWL